MQNALKDERLKFEDKTKPSMKIDVDHLQGEEAKFVEPVDIMMVEITENPFLRSKS